MKDMQERQRWSATLQGKYFNVLGHFFSLCKFSLEVTTEMKTFFPSFRLHVEDFYLHHQHRVRSSGEEGRRDERHRNHGQLVRRSVRHRLLVPAHIVPARRVHRRDIH